MLSSFRQSFIGIPFHKPYKNPHYHPPPCINMEPLSPSLSHTFSHRPAQRNISRSQEQMALMLSARRAQLNLFLQTMIAEYLQGLVTNKFLQLQTLKASCGRDFVVRTVILYWTAAKHLFSHMSSQLDMNDAVDFYDILSCADDLFERSNSIGAVHVSIACANIFNGCQENKKDRCMQGLITAKREFARLQVKFESIVEFERMIIECEDMLEREAQDGANRCELPTS